MQEAKIGDTGKSVIEQTCMVFGQMNEPPGSRLRVALSALTMAEYFRDQTGADTLVVCRQHLPLLAGRLGSFRSAGPDAVGRGLSADLGHRNGRPAGTNRLDQQREQSHPSRRFTYPADDPTDPAPGDRLRSAGRLHLSGTFDFRKRDLPGRRSACFVQPDSRSAICGRTSTIAIALAACRRHCSDTGNCKTSSPSSASMSSE